MLRFILGLVFVSLAFSLSSCFKEDEAVLPHTPGDYITDTVALTETYKYQVYYNLSDSSVVASLAKTSWDLGFDNSPNGWQVILNTSCFMKSAYLSDQIFGIPADTTGVTWLFNPSDGSADSLAVGKWFTVENNDTVGTNRILLIDRGLDENGISRGFYQFVIDSLAGGTYYFRIAAMNGANPRSFAVSKQGGSNHVLFSISNPTTVVEEPQSSDWDLLFTQYTTLLFTDVGDPYPYLVTGVLVNSKFVEVAVDSLNAFESIDFEKAQTLNYSKLDDKIGYLWKIYDFDAGIYTVDSDVIFVIRDTKGFLYKFRFIGFYNFNNNRSEKGYPSFEYQKL